MNGEWEEPKNMQRTQENPREPKNPRTTNTELGIENPE